VTDGNDAPGAVVVAVSVVPAVERSAECAAAYIPSNTSAQTSPLYVTQLLKVTAINKKLNYR